MPELFDLTLGRLAFRTIRGDVIEPLGDGLEAVGAALTAAERKPRPFEITLPVAGPRGTVDQAAQGERLRRQVRSLFNNAPARMNSLYMAFAADPSLDGWMVIGGGDVDPNGMGSSIGQYLLKLSDCYRVGTTVTHRAGRRLTAYDRRDPAVAIDTLGRFFEGAFPALAATPTHYLPVGAYDAIDSAGAQVTGPPLEGARGVLQIVEGRTNGEIIHFEQDPADFGKSDVLILDRPTPTSDPSEWVEVLGPDQSLTPGDIPALDNGIVRVRYVPAHLNFAVDRWDPAGDAWVEQGTVAIWPTSSAGSLTGLLNVTVREWTPERAVLRATFTASGTRLEVFLTMQIGWEGVRVEAYAPPDSAWTTPEVRWVTALAGSAASSGTNYRAVRGTAAAYYGVLTAVQNAAAFTSDTDTTVYGATRQQLRLAGASRYVSAQLSFPQDTTKFGKRALIDARQAQTLVAR